VIVLDTHAFLWWRDGSPRLSPSARAAIKDADRIGVPTACCLELATLERRGRVGLQHGADRWVRRALAVDRVEALELTAEVAITAGRLDGSFPGDPVDRIVYATAVVQRAQLVTRDARITAFDRDRVVW
jgi:PIN domain nuclease of toxin-antitoxin system